jgi:AraC-like DNA-binding protein
MKTFFDLLFILNGTLGLVCVFLVCLSIRSNRNVNIYLAVLLFAASIRLILRGYLKLDDHSELILSFTKSDLFLVGLPLPFLYFRNLALNKSKIESSDALHFIIPLLLTLEYNLHIFSSIVQVDLNFILKSVVILLCVGYCIMTIIVLSKNFWRKRTPIELQTDQQSLLKKWTIVLFITFLISGIKLMISQITDNNSGLLSDNFIVWISWKIVFIMILTSPSLLTSYITQLAREREKQTKPYSIWRLKPVNKITNPKDIHLAKKINGELEEYFLQIEQVADESQFFRKSDLTINEFALKSKIPVSHLSFIFKYHSEISFSDYKKRVRILDAVNLINEGYLLSNTLEALSKKVGFKTYNTFFIGFKEITSKTPQHYLNSLKD